MPPRRVNEKARTPGGFIMITATVTPEQDERLTRLASERRVSRSAVLRQLIADADSAPGQDAA